jgi:Glycosyltransferase family 87
MTGEQPTQENRRVNAPRKTPNAATAVVLAVSATVLALYAQSALKPKGLFAGDLPAYLVGWRLAISNPAKLYDLTTQRLTGRVVMGSDSLLACPFNYPPHLALLGRILPPLTYQSAVIPWVIGSVLVSVLGTYWWSRSSDNRLMMMATSSGVSASITAVLSGSIFPLVALGMLMVVFALSESNSAQWSTPVGPTVGAIGWMLLAIKPHLALVVALIGLIAATRKTLVTGALSVPVLVVAPTVAFGVGIWSSWARFLQQFSQSSQSDLLCRIPLAAPNVEGTAARNGIATSPAVIWAIYGIALLLLCVWVWRSRPALRTALAVGAAIVPLVAPHANPQDLALCLPFVLFSLFNLLSGSRVTRGIRVATCVLLMVSPWDRFMVEIQVLVIGLLLFGVYRLWDRFQVGTQQGFDHFDRPRVGNVLE